MEFVTGLEDRKVKTLEELEREESVGTEVTVEGMVHSIRDMGEISFVILRSRDGLLQTVIQAGSEKEVLSEIREGQAVRVTGTVFKEERAPHGIEIHLADARILSKPEEPMPIAIDKWKLPTSLEANLNRRAIALRNVRERAKFRIQEGICRGFREFMTSQGFTEIHTPKIGAKSAEGGANLFKLQYFHRPAVLAQSPQFYKQMMVGVFDRVFETGPVFRAEKHNTKRHLNEYTSLDFEMGFIDSFMDICKMETAMLQYVVELLKKDYAKEVALLKIELPNVEKIPFVRFDEAKRLIAEKYDRQIRSPHDLEPEEEALITENNRDFQQQPAEEQLFLRYFKIAEDIEEAKPLLASEILDMIAEKQPGFNITKTMILNFGKLLKRNSVPNKRTMRGTCYYVEEVDG